MAQDQTIDRIDDLLVVGVGASAGGLDAFSELLSHLPTDTGMAFVLVQHLSPDQESLLDELLDRTTPIAVVQAEDGVTVEANHVYVIPPGASMTIANGQLQLAKRRGGPQQGKTIDRFLCSLAADRKNKAIAVVLSGSNDDGAAGIRAVREEGGITFAQDCATTTFREMPSAAIATGAVDFVLSPTAIATELVGISQHPYVCEPPVSDDEAAERYTDGDLETVFARLRKHTGVDFAQYKRKTFERRLRRRMALHKLPALSDYVEFLATHPEEVQALFQDALITVTYFFRDQAVFDLLQQEVFPRLLRQPSAKDSIRIWVAGCSTGEEVYSVAMCLLECLDSVSISPTIQIFGTDISEQAIEEARAGQYLAARMEGVSPARRERFFSQLDGVFHINKSVRERCIFARHDLSNDPPFSGLDLVTCRNVLIYFQPSLQHRVLALFHYSLNPSGLLLLGQSESVRQTSDLFQVENDRHRLFKRASVPSEFTFDYMSSGAFPRADLPTPSSGKSAGPVHRSAIQQWADQIVLNRFAPVGVVVDDQLNIMQFRGETSAFLRPPLREPSFNLLKMVRPGLLEPVREAIAEAQVRGVAVQRHRLQADDNQARTVTLEVIPFNVSEARCCLVLFDDRPAPPVYAAGPETATAIAPPAPADTDAAVEELRRELSKARQELLDAQAFLQLTMDEQESIRQQLVAANEEVLSSNEELRSTNEELQTAKEEVQSANEELKTTNEELQSRNEEWRRANDDLLNLVNNVNIPTVMLSRDLRIRSFSPAARQAFNLIPTDVSRPIDHIRPNVDLPDLEQMVQEVMDTLHSLEREVQDREGRWYLLRVRPYRTIENQIDGAVLALIDIDNLRRTEEELRESQAQLERELSVTNQMRLLSLQLFSSLNLELALSEVLEAAIALLNADMGNVRLCDAAGETFTIEAHSGLDNDFLTRFAAIDANSSSACGRAIRHQRRVIVADTHTDTDSVPYRALLDTAGVRAMQSTPLLNRRGDVLGVLSTYFRVPHRPGDRELQLLDIYARQVSEFIELVRGEQERQELRQREQAAQAANANKDEFLSVLSHELRTPLNSILGWAQMLERGNLSQADYERAIATIHNSADTQLQLVEDLLDASRIIQERFSIQRQSTNLTAVAERAIALIRPQAEQKGLQLDPDLDPCPERLSADPQRLEQVFQNLLTNAVKFTPEGGRIAIRLTYRDTDITVQISDTGIGIEPEFLPHLFDQFRQADATNTRRAGGLGLGLFLIRSIVEAHGGTAQADSPGPGQGSTFTVTLPRIPAEVPAPPSSEPSPAQSALSLEGSRLLIVDDDDVNLELYSYFLEDFSATVLTATSAAEALDILDREPVDLIISDIGLPVRNGYELLREVRSRPANQGGDIPAIALSGYASQADIQAAIEAGFQVHLAKPVNLDELAIAIYSLMQE